MEQEWHKKVEEIFENNDINIEWVDDYAECSFASDLGEDFCFTISGNTLSEFIWNFSEYYDNFEPEEHAAMWYNNRENVSGVPDSLVLLLTDANMIDEVLAELNNELRKLV